MVEKVERAAIEGTLFKKAVPYVFKKLPVILLNKIDWYLGCVVRYIYAKVHKTDMRQIMFIPFQGDYTCNPKYIAEELLSRNKDFDIVFSARAVSMQNRMEYPTGVRLVEQYSANFYKEIAKSRILIVNSVEFLKKPVPKRNDQIQIETWHGSLGIKRFGEKENQGKSWVAAAKRCGRQADYVISNSQFEDNVYRDTFWKTTQILQYGHPRNDILFCRDDDLLRRIRKKVFENNIEFYEYEKELYNHRFILYAPTFRDNHSLSCYNIDFDILRDTLSKRFGGKWSVLVRLHPTVRKGAKNYTFDKNVFDVTSYPDIQELMMISDIAITDYSSWIYDFMLTRRPGFIFATDIDNYYSERGFYYPLTSTPFSVARSNYELIENILSFDEERYKREVDEFLTEKGCIDDGQASRRIVDKILELMGESE